MTQAVALPGEQLAAPPANTPKAQESQPQQAAASTEKRERLKVVTQRFTSARLLQHAVTPPNPDRPAGWREVESPGLLLHLSFTKFFVGAGDSGDATTPLSAEDQRYLRQVCKSLLTSSLTTNPSLEGWQADHSDACSIVDICKQDEAQALVVVPQASLTTKLVPGDKYLKYHSQCPKDAAYRLYLEFCATLADVLAELLGVKTNQGGKGGGGSANGKNGGGSRDQGSYAVPTDKYFEQVEGWPAACLDPETGFPKYEREDPSAQVEITKSKMKKLQKQVQLYRKKREKWLAAGGDEQEALATEAKAETEESTSGAAVVNEDSPLAGLERRFEALQVGKAGTFPDGAPELKEKAWPVLVFGTFGGRQGLEIKSTGPFTHSFSFA